MISDPGEPLGSAQRFAINLSFADSSIATILYGAAGASGLPKEYVEVHADGRSATLDDFRRLRLYEGRRTTNVRMRKLDKGHLAQARALRRRLEADACPEGWLDPLGTMAVTFAAVESAQMNRAVALHTSSSETSP